jgi:tRNA dimethylallyltransferase
MDIGTAKPTREERARLPHHLIDLVDPDEVYSAGRFVTDTLAAISDIRRRGKLPLLVGGTGFYLKALAEGTLNAPPSDQAVRLALDREAVEIGLPALHRRLLEADPASAARIHPHDRVRIVRALEIHHIAREGVSAFWEKERRPLPMVMLGLDMPRGDLYRRLDERVDRMMREGFVEEVRSLLAAGYGEELRSMEGIGYGQMSAFIAGRVTREEAVAVTKKATRNFAKRQLTWFRGMPGLEWLKLPSSGDTAGAAADVFERMTAGKALP